MLGVARTHVGRSQNSCWAFAELTPGVPGTHGPAFSNPMVAVLETRVGRFWKPMPYKLPKSLQAPRILTNFPE